ncbi:hypothetical protein BJX62DRAFT_63846 [Aspergillus germanicus]
MDSPRDSSPLKEIVGRAFLTATGLADACSRCIAIRPPLLRAGLLRAPPVGQTKRFSPRL